MKRVLVILSIFLLTSTSLFAELDFDVLLERIDNMQTFDGMDISLEWNIVATKPDEEKSVTKIKIFRRDSEDKFLYLILEPTVDKGQGFLMSGDNAWTYDPSSGKFAMFSLKENIGDSDANNNDVRASSMAEDYSISETSEGKLGKIDCHIVTLVANNNEVATPKLKLWINKKTELPMMQRDYSLSDRLVRTMVITKWTKLGDKFVAAKTVMKDELKKGEKTQITIATHNEDDPNGNFKKGDYIISNAKLDDSTFTQSYLQRINKE